MFYHYFSFLILGQLKILLLLQQIQTRYLGMLPNDNERALVKLLAGDLVLDLDLLEICKTFKLLYNYGDIHNKFNIQQVAQDGKYIVEQLYYTAFVQILKFV